MNNLNQEQMTKDNSDAIQTNHQSFDLKRTNRIDSLDITIEEYEHRKTGLKHYHLSSKCNENVFLISLRTVPMDSKGEAHILEHTVLCGSKNYPVRDPFFMMTRRSLNTFMNAFTSSDWTAYPFASKNKKDLFNLMDVYIDAIYFASLNKLDFAQEGHRLEFSSPGDMNSDLVYKGVVYNEMKGAMSSPVSTLWQCLTKHLFPTSTYHYNSGGEPDDITDLSYEELISFYKRHYHPSNSIMMTFGNIPACEYQAKLDSKIHSEFERSDNYIEVKNEVRFKEPINIVEHYSIDDEDSKNKTHIVIGWLLGNNTDLRDVLTAHLLSGVLLNNGSSPLRHALESTNLGSSPSPLCGIEDSSKEIIFACGVEGSNPESDNQVEKLVYDVLRDVATNGVPLEQVEAVLHQIELQQREITGDSYPYGLHLILDALPYAIHRGDPVAALDLDSVIIELRKDIQDPEFIKSLVENLLINNNHRIRLTLVPDNTLSEKKSSAEKSKLDTIKNNLGPDQISNIIKIAEDLEARQDNQDDPDILPKVELGDIPKDMTFPDGNTELVNDKKLTFFNQGTNGIVYQQHIYELPALTNELSEMLPYYSSCLTELGIGKMSYLETQALQAQVSGGISAHASIRSYVDDVNNLKSYFTLSGKALSRNNSQLASLLHDTSEEIRFDEHERIREIVAQKRAQSEQSITGNGHALVMMAASSGISSIAELNHKLRGLHGIKSLKKLDKDLDDKNNITELSRILESIHSEIKGSESQFLMIGDNDDYSKYLSAHNELWSNSSLEQNEKSQFSLPSVSQKVKQLWIANTQVNFSSKAYPAVSVNHPDAPAFAVLGEFLRNGYLHRTIREQGGAYGAGASYDSNSASFRFYSYRDPRIMETLADFDHSIEWVLDKEHEWRELEESILGVISSIDKPRSPSGEAKDVFHNSLYGRTTKQRRQFRENILNVTYNDLAKICSSYLTKDNASIAVLTNESRSSELLDLSMDVHHV